MAGLISNGSFVLGDPNTRDLYLGKGLKDGFEGDKYYIATDETVLWEADLSIEVHDRDAGTTFNLSDFPTNFEYVDIFFAKRWPRTEGNDTYSGYLRIPSNFLNATAGYVLLTGRFVNSGTLYNVTTMLSGFLTKTVTEVNGSQTTAASITVGSKCYLHPYKIIGVNRKRG